MMEREDDERWKKARCPCEVLEIESKIVYMRRPWDYQNLKPDFPALSSNIGTINFIPLPLEGPKAGAHRRATAGKASDGERGEEKSFRDGHHRRGREAEALNAAGIPASPDQDGRGRLAHSIGGHRSLSLSAF